MPLTKHETIPTRARLANRCIEEVKIGTYEPFWHEPGDLHEDITMQKQSQTIRHSVSSIMRFGRARPEAHA